MSAKIRRVLNNEIKLQGEFMGRLGNAIMRAHVAEVLLVMQAFSWGIWLLLPGRTEGVFVEKFLNGFSQGTVWGCVSISLGLGIVSGIVLEKPQIKKWSLLASSSWWVFIAVFFGMRNIYSTGVPTYISIAVAAGLSYIKQELRDGKE